jgi:hypothetical protein
MELDKMRLVIWASVQEISDLYRISTNIRNL